MNWVNIRMQLTWTCFGVTNFHSYVSFWITMSSMHGFSYNASSVNSSSSGAGYRTFSKIPFTPSTINYNA